MPNYVRNLLLVGDESKMNEIVKAHCPIDKETGTPEMDFNTIKKMPEELNVEVSTRSEDGLKLYLARVNPDIKYYGTATDKVNRVRYNVLTEKLRGHVVKYELRPITEEEAKGLIEKYGKDIRNIETLGIQQITNVLNYGAMNWYEWSIKNWGCKWNACDTEIHGRELRFDTPWSPALEALLELSRLHPTFPMVLLFADEQTGAKVGYLLMKGGRIDDSGSFKDFSVDAYKLAFKVLGNQDDYIFDPKRNTYLRRELAAEEAGA